MNKWFDNKIKIKEHTISLIDAESVLDTIKYLFTVKKIKIKNSPSQ